jgi:hypothetical protein
LCLQRSKPCSVARIRASSSEPHRSPPTPTLVTSRVTAMIGSGTDGSGRI